MGRSSDRRQFLAKSATAGAALTLGDLGFLSRLQPVSAAEADVNPAEVGLDSGISGTVRFIETVSVPPTALLPRLSSQLGRRLR